MEPMIVCRCCAWEGIRKQLAKQKLPNEDHLLVCPICEHPEFRPKERIKFEYEDDDFEGGFVP